MSPTAAVWFEFYVEDMERAKKFYEGVFQLKLEKISSTEPELWGFPRPKEGLGINGALAKMTGVRPGGSTLVYFGCTDCSVEARRIVEFGGSIHREKSPIGQHGFIALAVDTEGNMFGLHSMQ